MIIDSFLQIKKQIFNQSRQSQINNHRNWATFIAIIFIASRARIHWPGGTFNTQNQAPFEESALTFAACRAALNLLTTGTSRHAVDTSSKPAVIGRSHMKANEPSFTSRARLKFSSISLPSTKPSSSGAIG